MSPEETSKESKIWAGVPAHFPQEESKSPQKKLKSSPRVAEGILDSRVELYEAS